jgi:hypothetical protein
MLRTVALSATSVLLLLLLMMVTAANDVIICTANALINTNFRQGLRPWTPLWAAYGPLDRGNGRGAREICGLFN